MLVVDASAVTELLLSRPLARSVEERAKAHRFGLHAPHLLDVEVTNALRRLVAAGDAHPGRAGDAIIDLLDLPIDRYPHDILIPRIWALRENFSAYDAAYVALAESLTDTGVPLLTADTRLARAAEAATQIEILLAE